MIIYTHSLIYKICMYVFIERIALNEKLQCHHDTIKSCIVLTNFKNRNFSLNIICLNL